MAEDRGKDKRMDAVAGVLVDTFLQMLYGSEIQIFETRAAAPDQNGFIARFIRLGIHPKATVIGKKKQADGSASARKDLH